ncbi:MAG: cytochrome c oxidase subunit II [Deltaproteobacteria bacterium]|nr:MAG: cytochrome c oxidase subunit II [Deltaproteobacteria bacterium]
MHPQTTTQAVDTAFYVIFAICGIMLAGIAVAMIWFVWRYNRKRQPVPLSQKDHNLWLEVTWTAIPTVLVMLMFWYGWEGYLSLRRIPDDAMHIKATGRMWSWLFTYDNGRSADKLFVPVGQPVKIELLAEDVLHSFYVPAFRVKRDMVPGMVNWVWFTADKPGSFDLFCAEYCGVGHSAMVTTVEALPAAEFQAWLNAAGSTGGDPAARGLELAGQLGCLGCHSVDGSRRVGPSLKGVFGAPRAVLRSGARATVTADAAYLKRALMEPAAEIVEGYPPAMPPYTQLSEADLAALLAWLESLK